MKLFSTQIKAIDPIDNKLKTWSGQKIKANCFLHAEQICKEMFGYLTVTGEFVEDVEFDIRQTINLN